MRTGDTFVINIDKIIPDFHSQYTDQHIFPADQILDWDYWHSDDNYMKIVKDEENYDLLGNKKMYYLMEKFQICILALYESDEQIFRITNKIPNSDLMVRLIIEK